MVLGKVICLKLRKGLIITIGLFILSMSSLACVLNIRGRINVAFAIEA